jgi:hypothetical protein
VFAVWGAFAIARRFFFRDADFVSQLLLVGIVANLAAYIPSTLADHTALNTREIAPVLPFAAVLAGRMLGDRLLTGPLATIRLRLPRFGPRAAPGAVGASAAGGRRTYSLGVRLAAVPLVALFGWFSFGLFRQADTPAAPPPLAGLAAYLESKHLHYGLSGYWQASVLTVETGGKVTVRAVSSACLQPYQWESKTSWYDAKQHTANFILLSSLPGYFNQFSASGDALQLLNNWSGGPAKHDDFDGYFYKEIQVPGKNGKLVSELGKFPWVSARVYPLNLLTELPRLKSQLNDPPAVVCD